VLVGFVAAFGVAGVSPGVAFGAPEVPVTEAASGVAGTSATVHGELNPHSKVLVGYEFAYSTGSGCHEGTVTAPAAEAVREKSKVSVVLTGLEGSTTYVFCAVATHLEGETLEETSGGQLSFKTTAAKPVITPENEPTPVYNVSGLTPFDAALEGRVNPENQATAYHFEYANNVGMAGATSIGAGTLPGVSEPQGVGPVDIGGGLEPSSTYYFRLVASDGSGVTNGPVESFETPAAEPPVVQEESVSSVTQTNATLNATIEASGQATHYQFLLGTSTTYTLTTGLQELAGAFGGQAVSVNLESEGITLAANTEYHYEAVAENPAGESEGLTALGDETFLTPPNPPTVTTGTPASVAAQEASVTGSVNPGSTGQAQDETTYAFQYGHTTGYGTQTAPVTFGQGTTPTPVTATLPGLEPGSVYHYRLTATNDGGTQTTYGADETLETPSTPPLITGLAATATQTTVTITASLDPENLPTRYELQAGATFGALAPQAAGNTTTTTPLAVTISSLTPATTYYYQLTATNANGTTTSQGTTITLPAPPATGPLAQPPTPTLLATPNILIPGEPVTPPPPPKLTNKQKLANALKTCRKTKNKHKRHLCEKHAHHTHPTHN
jgi:hypothetical protein